MTALTASAYWMAGVFYCFVACLLTVVSSRPWKWLELGAMYLVVWPLLRAWRRAA